MGDKRPSRFDEVRRLRALGHKQEIGVGGTGEPYDTTQQNTPKPKKPKKSSQTRAVERLIPAGYETYPMNNQFVVAARGDFGAWGIWGFLTWLLGPTLAVAIFIIPVMMPSLMRYGYIQYVFFGPLYAWNMLLPKITDQREFYQLALILNAVALGVELWLGAVLAYNWYACSFGVYPSECKDNYPPDLYASVFTFAFIIIGVASVGKLLFVLSRTSNTSPPTFLRVTNY